MLSNTAETVAGAGLSTAAFQGLDLESRQASRWAAPSAPAYAKDSRGAHGQAGQRPQLRRIDTPEDMARSPRALALDHANDEASRSVIGAPIRRCLDLIIALAATLMFAPVILLIAIGIRLEDGGPILFVQDRVGRGGRLFKCLKFRSMVVDAEARLQTVLESSPAFRRDWIQYRKLKSDPRITKFGDFIRRTSLDELPQLYNILKGDMSVVGPRPIIRSEINLYGRGFRHYVQVRPGLTGLWQISGRNELSFRTRVAMDRLSIRTRSLSLYFFIIGATVPAVLTRRGSR